MNLLLLFFINFCQILALPMYENRIDKPMQPVPPGCEWQNSTQREILGQYPEAKGGYFEGDMIDVDESRNGIINLNKRWPGGVVPVYISRNFTKDQIDIIKKVFQSFKAKTCIRFVRANHSNVDYVRIRTSPYSCSSRVGRSGGSQSLYLADVCFETIGTVIHEFIHALGFFHQHVSEDRDNFVTICTNNIMAGHENNFNVPVNGTIDFGVQYDYDSLMHYPKIAFSKDEDHYYTIVPKNPNAEIGQRDDFSEGDLKKINAMYNCTKAE